MDYRYHVVPFLAQVNSRDSRSADRIAAQLQSVIDTNVTEGWEFYRIDQVQVSVKRGCLGALLGQKETLMALDHVILRRELA
jgi:hypothetical protein